MSGSQDFNGSTQYVGYSSSSVGPHKSFTYPFSLGCWFNADVVTGGISKYPIAICSDDATSNWFGIRINGGNIGIGASGTGISNYNIQAISTSTWYFCVIEANGFTDRRMYINGVQAGTTDTSSVQIIIANLNLSCVGTMRGQSSNFLFDGKVAYPFMTNRALTLGEQNEMMRKPNAIPQGLLWRPSMNVNGSAVGDYVDLSGQGYNPNAGTAPTSFNSGPPVFFPTLLS